MFPDVLFNTLFVSANRADAVSLCPETATEQSTSGPQYAPMDSNRTFAFQVPDGMRDAVLGRHAEQHMDMVWHHLTFQKLYSALLAPLAKYFPHSPTYFPIKCFSTVFRDDNYTVLAFPLYMCLTLSILHWRSSLPFWGLPRGDRLSFPRRTRQSLLNCHRQSRWITIMIYVVTPACPWRWRGLFHHGEELGGVV